MGQYQVRRKLGAGGMGEVWLFHHNFWQTDLAAKIPLAAQHLNHSRLREEADLWTRLGLHPNIVYCHYVQIIDQIPCIFVEYVPGCNLEEFVETGQLYDVPANRSEAILERILDIAIQTARGLQHAHELAGHPHCDVKPANVLIEQPSEACNPVAKVTDFGISRSISTTGTIGYNTPEQARGETPTLATDVWSWALTLLAMLHGGPQWPFLAWNHPSLMDNAEGVKDIMDPLLDGTEGFHSNLRVPAELMDVLRDCLAFEAGNRPEMKSVEERLVLFSKR